MSGYAVKWVDGYGRAHWQPHTENDESLWCASSYADGMHQVWGSPTQESSVFLAVHGPVTYRSRARAERVARRRQARQEVEALRKIHPVQGEETES